MKAELMHDLRTPLQLMMSCAQLLEAEVGENRQAQDYIQMLLSSAREMQRMLSGALENLRPGAGGMHLERCDIVSRTWETCARCRLYAERKGVKLTFCANVDRLETALDEEKYSRVLLNLLSNAIKFTPEGGNVRVAITAMGDDVEICVIDDGCGIEPERLERIFELHETDSGYGYGLYIAREYARRMGGGLRVESEPGKGSCFTVRIPVGNG